MKKSGALLVLTYGLAIWTAPSDLWPAPKLRAEILVSTDNDIYAQALAGVQSVLAGEVQITYLDSMGDDPNSLADFFLKRDDGQRTSVFLTIGSRATKAALSSVRHVPVIYSMVNSPKTFVDFTGRSCGISLDVPITEYFRILREMAPSARRVYAFYSTNEGEYQAAEGDYSDLRYGFQYRRIRVEDKRDFSSSLGALKGKTDAFYLIADPLYDSERFAELSAFCRENHIVLMSGFESLMRAGSTFAIAPSYGKIGVTAGNMANKVVSGESDCAKEGTLFPDQVFLSLNLDYARASGLDIPPAIVERARLTELFNAGVHLLNDGKTKSAKLVFETILRRDPGNQSAIFYRELISQRLTGTETRPLLIEAKRQRESGNLEAALASYRRTLRVSPGHPDAVEGEDFCLTSLSESARKNGELMARSGQTLDAMRRYLMAVQYSERNTRARAELEQLRRALQPNVAAYFKEGVQHYQDRNYKAALQSFENVLLVDPAHKQAQEYVRIASKKKEAVDRLMHKP